jgi:hypothetical protein
MVLMIVGRGKPLIEGRPVKVGKPVGRVGVVVVRVFLGGPALSSTTPANAEVKTAKAVTA